MIVDHLMRRIASYGDDRHTAQIWLRHDNRYRVVLLERIGESSRYREVDGATWDNLEDAQATFVDWRTAIQAGTQ